jgi:sugar phosphate isomerase/epimerase
MENPSMSWTLSAFADEAGGSTDEQIAALNKAGITHIDPRSLDGHSIVKLPLDVAEQVQAKYQAAGIQVNMFGSPIGKIDIADDIQVDLDRLTHLGKLKDIFGCNKVRIFSYYNKQGASKDEWKARTRDNLKQICELAASLGMELYHENESHIYGDASDDVLDLADLRDGKSFFFIYDFANYIRTGEEGWDTWQKMKSTTDILPLQGPEEERRAHADGPGRDQFV